MTALVVALGLVVALLGVLVVGLLRSHAEILRSLHDLGVNLEEGAPRGAGTDFARSAHPPARTAPGVPGPREDGAPRTAVDVAGTLPLGGAGRIAVRDVEHSTLLAFLSSGCGTCGTFWDALRDDARRALPDPSTRIAVITNGPDAESPAAVADLAPPHLVTLMSTDAWDDYGVPVSPYFVLVDGSTGRVVGEGAGSSWDQVVDLLAKATADGAAVRRGQDRARPPRMNGQDRADRVDRELLAAGIEPGDESLYPAVHPSRVEGSP